MLSIALKSRELVETRNKTFESQEGGLSNAALKSKSDAHVKSNLIAIYTKRKRTRKMKLDDVFPSTYLKSSDLQSEDVVFTIRSVERKEFDDEPKPICWFEETSKGLVLNRTNFKSIAKLHGDDSEDWHGQRITLFGTEVTFRGTPTTAIRVRLTVPEKDPVPF